MSMTSTSSAGGSSSTAAGVRIVVAGDRGTGKSTLIVTAATSSYPTMVPPVLPPTRMPEQMFPGRVPVTVIDTSYSVENRGKHTDELQKADAVVLTCACDQPATLERLSSFWLPELRRLEVKVPVIVAGCKLDLIKDEQQHSVSLEQWKSPIMQQFPEVETWIECSACEDIQIPKAFYYSQKAVLYPTTPLFDKEAKNLKPRCVRALKRIFSLCDNDRDGALSDAELNDLQVKCFNAPWQPSEIAGVKKIVQRKLPEGVNENGLTLAGFLSLHALFIEKGRLEKTWTVLRKFGYTNEMRLGDLPRFKRTPDQSVELTSEAVEFLRGVFSSFDKDRDGALNAQELDDVFSTAPESPWNVAPYANAAAAAENNALEGLSLDGFLAKWALMTLVDPVLSVENLIYLGYAGKPSRAVTVTRGRRVDRKKQHSDRNVFQCFVFGPKEAGKSSFLQSFVRSPFSETYTPTTEERCTVHFVGQPDGTSKTLILREIPEDAIEKLLKHKDALAACDIAVFVLDSSSKASRLRTTKLLVQVASHGESTGYEVPCLIVAAKDDLEPRSTAIRYFRGVSQDMGIAAPLLTSTKMGDFNYLYRGIVRAAEHPHLSIPKTEAGVYFTGEKVNTTTSEEKVADYPTKQEAEAAFKSLLEDSNVKADWNWKQAMEVIINDKRYGALKTLGERKQAFSEYLMTIKKLETKERRLKKRKASEEYTEKLLEQGSRKKAKTSVTGSSDSVMKEEPAAVEIPWVLAKLVQIALHWRGLWEKNKTDKGLCKNLKIADEQLDTMTGFYSREKLLPVDNWKYHPDTASTLVTRLDGGSKIVPFTSIPKNEIIDVYRIIQGSRHPKRDPTTEPVKFDNVPLKEKALESWEKFKIDDSKNPVARSIHSHSDKYINRIEVAHSFVSTVADFAVEVYNNSYEKHVREGVQNYISSPRCIECKYHKRGICYWFYLTIEAVEDDLPGVYDATVECRASDGALSLGTFELDTEQTPSGTSEMATHYETSTSQRIKDARSGVRMLHPFSGMRYRGGSVRGSGYNFCNPNGRW